MLFHHLGMDQYLLIPFLVGWTSINPSYFDVNYRGTRFWHTAISKFPNLHHSPCACLSDPGATCPTWPCGSPWPTALLPGSPPPVTGPPPAPATAPWWGPCVRGGAPSWWPRARECSSVHLGSMVAWTKTDPWPGPLSLVAVNLGNQITSSKNHSSFSLYLDSPCSCQQKSAVELEKHQDTQTHNTHNLCNYLKPTLQPGVFTPMFRNI